jgi:polysaccharide transporter, PST family
MSLKPFDANGDFYPVAKAEGLRRAAVRGAGVMVFAQGVSFAVQLAATVVLARLLTPADFGVVTMVTTFSLLLCSFGLNGFTETILQREEVTHFLASNLFWINIGAGVVLTLAFAALGPLIALFYHDPLVTHVVEGMSLTILAASGSVIHLALMNRAMRFAAVSANGVVARAVCIIVSIILALAGWGYWALVVGNIALQLSTTVGAWLMCRWIPGRPRRVPGTGACVKFAINVYSRFSFSYFSGNTDNLLVGWRFGAGALGLYKKAFDLFFVPVCQLLSPMSAVAVTTLSRFNRDRTQYQRYFLSGLSVLALLGMGIGADFTLIGGDLIRLILGPNWAEAGRIFAFFGPGIGVMLLYNTHGWIHISIGRPDRWFRWAVIEFLCTAGLFLILLPWGPRGIALAWTVSFFVLMLPAFWYAGKPIGFGVDSVLAVVWKFFVASVVAGGSVAWLIHIMRPFAATPGALGAFARLVSVSLLFSALYLGMVIALHRGLEPLRQAARLVGDLLPQRAAPPSLSAIPTRRRYRGRCNLEDHGVSAGIVDTGPCSGEKHCRVLESAGVQWQAIEFAMATCFPPAKTLTNDTGAPGDPATPTAPMEVGLLTGGRDRHYAFGLAMALISKGVCLDVIGSDEVDSPEMHSTPRLKFLNLYDGWQKDASLVNKSCRILLHYVRLIRYAAIATPRIFHILWNNKFQFFDRTVLTAYYKLLGKKIVFTAHNVNAGKRDLNDSWLNRLTLKIQYRLVDHIFVHTQKMKNELVEEFGVDERAITVIPFGINNSVPDTDLTPGQAKQRLGIKEGEKTILFFGNIGPYKGLEFLVAAFQRLVSKHADYRLIIAGKLRGGAEKYWGDIRSAILRDVSHGRVIQKIEFISDEETELYFKAADVLALPYTQIYQSGVLFLGYSFGLPVIAADVGSLGEGVVEGRTGFLCRPCDPVELANTIETYFDSDLFKGLNRRRQEIRAYANERNSWDVVGGTTRTVYEELLGRQPS